MPSAINSDNGVVSGTAGLKSSADSSGVLDLQTNGTTAISISASQVVSFANQPTYTGGTANGVMFLNGSKAVTTGTALTFDGTNLGIGTASPQAYSGFSVVSVDSATNGGVFSARRSGTAYLNLYSEGSFGVIEGVGTGVGLRFYTNNAERARLDSSGNLLLGTTAGYSSERLVVDSNGGSTSYNSKFVYSGSSNTAYCATTWSHGQSGTAIGYAGVGGSAVGNTAFRNAFVVGTQTASALVFNTSDSEKARFDASGNFGIGTTSPTKRLQFGTTTSGSVATPVAFQFADDYSSGYTAAGCKLFLYNIGGTEIYGIASGPASDIQYHAGGAGNTLGRHAWYSGNTERMRLDATGNLGVGTAGATYRIEGWIANSGTLQNGFNITNGANADFTVRIKTNETWVGPTTNTPFIFANNNNTERARIDSSGNFMIGGTSTTAKLAVANNTNDGTYSIRQYAVFGTTTTYLDSDAANLWGGGLGEFQIQNGTATRPAMLSMGGSVNTDEGMGVINFFRSGNDDSFRSRVQIAGVVGSTGTAGRHGGYLAIRVAADGQTDPAQVAQFNPSGTVILKGGTTSADGTGITFPATQSASANANTLDDYEEGSWTPNLSGSSGGVYTMGGVNAGRYIRIGRMVWATATLQWTGRTTAFSGNLWVAGLPFTSTGNRASGSMGAISYGLSFTAGYGEWNYLIDPSYTAVYIIQNSTTGSGYSHTPNVDTTGLVYSLSIVYEAG